MEAAGVSILSGRMLDADNTRSLDFAHQMEQQRFNQQVLRKMMNRTRERRLHPEGAKAQEVYPLIAGRKADLLTDNEYFQEVKEWTKPQVTHLYGGLYSGVQLNRRVSAHCGGCGWVWTVSAASAEDAICPNCHNRSHRRRADGSDSHSCAGSLPATQGGSRTAGIGILFACGGC